MSRASSSADSITPGGGVEPPREQPALNTSNTRIQPQTDLETRRREEASMIIFRGIWKPRGPARIHDPRPRRPDGRSTSPTGPDRQVQTEGLTDHRGDLTSPERPAPAALQSPRKPTRQHWRVVMRNRHWRCRLQAGTCSFGVPRGAAWQHYSRTAVTGTVVL